MDLLAYIKLKKIMIHFIQKKIIIIHSPFCAFQLLNSIFIVLLFCRLNGYFSFRIWWSLECDFFCKKNQIEFALMAHRHSHTCVFYRCKFFETRFCTSGTKMEMHLAFLNWIFRFLLFHLYEFSQGVYKYCIRAI